MTAPEPTYRTTEPDDVFDAHLAGWEAATPVDIAADVREELKSELSAWLRAMHIRERDGDWVVWDWRDEADRLIGGPLAPLLAARAATSADPGPDTADQLQQRVHDLADRHERSAAHRERLAARWTDAERHQLADAFRRLAHQSRVEALRVRAVAGPRRDEEAGR